MKNLLFLLTILFVNSTFSQKTAIKDPTLTSNEVPFDVIEQVPVFPGCEKKKDNSSRAKCMNQKIGKHVSKNFDTKSFNVSKGKYKIKTIFNIDINGKITDIKVLAPYPMMEEEAIRVISSIPDMLEPGYQEEKPVVISYFLPINFVVENGSR